LSYLLNTITRLDHLDFGDIVGPSLVSQDFGSLATEIKSLVKQRHVIGKSSFVALLSALSREWVFGKFEL
jgi:hypothetical protein